MLSLQRLTRPTLRALTSLRFFGASATVTAPARPLRCLPAVASGHHRRFLSSAATGVGGVSHDAKLSSLLDSELRYEKTSAQDPTASQPPAGFTVTAQDGTLFTLTRKCPDDGSLLEVSFDLNGSTSSAHDEDVDADEDSAERHTDIGSSKGGEDADGPDTNAEEILSRPDVTFRVRKPSAASADVCLVVRCSFPPLHVSQQMAVEDPDYPSFSIDTVAMEGSALGEYELEADMLNDDLYKQLAEMLVHRGVTRAFEQSLVQFCTAQEHQIYLRFLAEAKKFCDL